MEIFQGVNLSNALANENAMHTHANGQKKNILKNEYE